MSQINSKQLIYPLSGSFTGSLYGTSSYAISASYVINGAKQLSGGTDGYIPLWSGSTALTSSFLNQSGNILKSIYTDSDVGLKLDFANGDFRFGDFFPIGNANRLIIDNLTGESVFAGNNNSQGFYISHVLSGRQTVMGDWDNGYSGTKIIVDDSTQTITVSGSVITSGSIGIGTIPTTKLDIAGNDTDKNTAQFGTIGIQSFGVNNAWFGDNAYFNGSQFVRRADGYSGLFYFQGDEGQFRFGDSNPSGSAITNGSGYGKVTLKTNLDGTFAIGDLSYSSANYSGAKFIVTPTGSVGINTIHPSSNLEVNGTIGLQYRYVDLTLTGNYVIVDNTDATIYRFSNTSAGDYTVELPPADIGINRTYWVSRGDDTRGGGIIGNITINCSSNIEDKSGNFFTSLVLPSTHKFQWVSDGTQWILIMSYTP